MQRLLRQVQRLLRQVQRLLRQVQRLQISALPRRFFVGAVLGLPGVFWNKSPKAGKQYLCKSFLEGFK